MKLKKLLIGLSLAAGLAGIGASGIEADAAITSDMKELDVEIKYGKKEVEFEYEVKRNGVSASYKNELTGERLSGTAAKNKIESLMRNVDVKNHSRSSIASALASQVSSQRYTKFSLEAEYNNRREIEFSLRN